MKMTMDELKQIIKDVLEEVQSEAAVDDLEVDEPEDLDSTEESEDSAEPVENAELDGDELPLSDEDTDSDKDEKDVEESVEPKQTLNESKADIQKLETFAGEDLAKRFLIIKKRVKAPYNDIYYWLKQTPKALEKFVINIENKKSIRQKQQEISDRGTELVYDEECKIYHITTYEASAKYGKNTEWCISGSKIWSDNGNGEQFFNDYHNSGIEFYFVIYSNDEKYAIAYNENINECEIFDSVDNPISEIPYVFKYPDKLKISNANISGKILESFKDIEFDEFNYVVDFSRPIPKAIKQRVQEIIIANGVESIEKYAFTDYPSLTSVKIPNSMTSIGDCAFFDCPSLTSVTIPDSITSIGESAFAMCPYLTDITIPDSVTSIRERAFQGCHGITSITIPKGVTSIEYETFADCWFLNSVTISDSVTSIGEYAFADCHELTSMTIPDSVTSIGEGAFLRCKYLETISLPNHNIEIDKAGIPETTKIIYRDESKITEALSLDEFSYYINGQEVDEETFCQALKDEVASEFSADRIDAEYENAMACFYNVARHNTPGDIYPQGYGNRDFQVILKCFA